MNQADVVGLLTVGSASAPKEEVLKIGDAGTKQLVEIRQDGEERGLSNFFGAQKVESVLTPAILRGRDLDKAISARKMPPMPTALGQNANATAYTQLGEEEQAYPDRYVDPGLLRLIRHADLQQLPVSDVCMSSSEMLKLAFARDI